MSLHTILDMGRAWFRGDVSAAGNEVYLDAKPGTEDPVGYRGGNFTPGLYFRKDSGDLLAPKNPDDPPDAEPRRLEKVMVGYGPEDDSDVAHWIAEGKPGGSWNLSCQRPGTEDDGNMIRVIRATSRYLEFFGRKICRRNADGSWEWLMGGAASTPGRFYHEGGTFCTIYQRDGHVVQYKIVDAAGNPLPETEWPNNVCWTNQQGVVRPLPW